MFLFRLAKDLKKSVSELKQSMSYWEYMLWQEFYKRERDEMKKLSDKMRKRR